MAACGGVGEAEQFQFACDLHVAEADPFRRTQREVGLQRLGQVALLLLQVSQRGARALIVGVAPQAFADFEIATLADGTEVATSPLATEA
jgi:hypothetical protein